MGSGDSQPAPSSVRDYLPDSEEALRALVERWLRSRSARGIRATSVVHDSYLRMARRAAVHCESSAHFKALASRTVRSVLVDRWRRREVEQRWWTRELETGSLEARAPDDQTLDLDALDRALDALAKLDVRRARIVEMRFFGGLGVAETADALGISAATVKRDWALARAWLLREIDGRRAS